MRIERLPEPPVKGMSVPSTTTPKAEPAVSAQLSPMAVLLSEEGLDFDTSRVVAQSTNVDFNLEFHSNSVERLTASGYYSEKTESLHISWQATFQKEVIVDGRTELHTFEAELQVDVSQVNRQMISTVVYKEDILSLVQRLIEDIHEVATDDNKLLGGVILEYRDLLEIMSLDHGRLAHDLMALIELTITLARLKQLLEGNNKDVVILAPEREETRGVTINEAAMRVESFQLEIRDVTAELSQASAEAQPTSITPEVNDLSVENRPLSAVPA